MPSATTKSEPGLGDEPYFIIQAALAPRLDVRKEMEIDRAIARLVLQKI